MPLDQQDISAPTTPPSSEYERGRLGHDGVGISVNVTVPPGNVRGVKSLLTELHKFLREIKEYSDTGVQINPASNPGSQNAPHAANAPKPQPPTPPTPPTPTPPPPPMPVNGPSGKASVTPGKPKARGSSGRKKIDADEKNKEFYPDEDAFHGAAWLNFPDLKTAPLPSLRAELHPDVTRRLEAHDGPMALVQDELKPAEGAQKLDSTSFIRTMVANSRKVHGGVAPGGTT